MQWCTYRRTEKETRGPRGHYRSAEYYYVLSFWVRFLSWSETKTAIPIGSKHTNLSKGIEILLPVKFRSKKSKMSQPFRGQGSQLVFTISLKNANLVEDIEILLPVKFRWILFQSVISEEKSKMSKSIRCQGGHFVFSNRPDKHKLGKGHWDLAYCQVLLNAFQKFHRRSQKCFSKSEARAAILFFQLAWKTQTW